MNGRHERIERLAERWLAARTTEAEERELRELLRTEKELPESLRDLAMLFEGFGALAEERMPHDGAVSPEFAARSDGKPRRPFAGGIELPPESAPAAHPELVALPDSSVQEDAPVLPSARGRRGRRMRIFWGVAAAAVVILGIFLGAEWLREPYCYINGKPVYDKEVAMQTTAYFDSFAVLDAPARLVDELIENN